MKLDFLKTTRQDSINKKILRAAVTVGGVSFLVKAGVIVKDLAVARSFGRNDSLDAFLFAFMLPSFGVTLVMGAISSATVPVLIETRQKEGSEAAQRLLSTVILLATAALVTLALILGGLQSWYLPLLGHSFSTDKLHLTRDLLYWLLPWLVLSGLATFLASILNAEESFALPALVPILTPAAVFAFVLLGAKYGGFSLAGGTISGSLLEAAALFLLARRRGLLRALRWHGCDGRVRTVLTQSVPLMGGCLLMGATPVVDQTMAATLAPGSVAALNYGNKVVTGILAIGAMALSTAALPYFSRMAAESNWQGCRHTLKRFANLVLVITVPLTILLVVFSKPLVRILFQRGAFSSTDTDVVSAVQACYLLQIPFYTLSVLFARFISAVRRNKLLLYASALNLAVDIVMNLVLMRIWGVAGIALSSSVFMLGSMSFLGISSLSILKRQGAGEISAVPAPARHQLL